MNPLVDNYMRAGMAAQELAEHCFMAVAYDISKSENAISRQEQAMKSLAKISKILGFSLVPASGGMTQSPTPTAKDTP